MNPTTAIEAEDFRLPAMCSGTGPGIQYREQRITLTLQNGRANDVKWYG
jgi:hypothetical protein